jgi:hypothetical protein
MCPLILSLELVLLDEVHATSLPRLDVGLLFFHQLIWLSTMNVVFSQREAYLADGGCKFRVLGSYLADTAKTLLPLNNCRRLNEW